MCAFSRSNCMAHNNDDDDDDGSGVQLVLSYVWDWTDERNKKCAQAFSWNDYVRAFHRPPDTDTLTHTPRQPSSWWCLFWRQSAKCFSIGHFICTESCSPAILMCAAMTRNVNGLDICYICSTLSWWALMHALIHPFEHIVGEATHAIETGASIHHNALYE